MTNVAVSADAAKINGDAEGFIPFHVTTRDGLRLYARHYPARTTGGRRPLLCLAGLTRNSRDFHDLAVSLATHADSPRDVYTLDTRGRGHSDHDKDWRNYSVPVEMNDAIDLIAARELANVALIGTSRGGLIAMVMAAAQPTAIGALILNDIGPVVERDGLLRIASYVGKTPAPNSWAHAGQLAAEINRRQFPRIADEQWQSIARQWFNEKSGKPVPSYDPQLARALSVMDGPMPELWPQFKATTHVPLLVIRGANSDILSQQTLEQMNARHPNMNSHIVAEEGHAPLLHDHETQNRIAQFLAHSDNSYGEGG
ncbi:MAG: alpha/beta hydrolase [Hyphomicrobiaceae bacterium]|nr:alpha/beta hydrolase [Hyphomicrobiaceae bacterium]